MMGSSIWDPEDRDGDGGEPYSCSDRENYFWRAGQNVRQALNALPDILSPGRTFSLVDDWQISVVIFVVIDGHFMCIEPCWT